MIGDWELDSINHTDLFALCDGLPDGCVDMILCDLPYGTTACSWDTVIPFAPMWERFKRVIKPRGAIVLTASQPFTSALVMSNPKMFRYEWIWGKNIGSGGMNANKMPIRRHENVLVFYSELPAYSPQFTKGQPYVMRRNKPNLKSVYGKTGVRNGFVSVNAGIRFPDSILKFDTQVGYHPTQKPVALFEYLIRTYTREGELVLDPCVGSGTSALAARNAKRHWICGDSDSHYCDVARDRLRLPFEPRTVKASDDVSDLPLFSAAERGQ